MGQACGTIGRRQSLARIKALAVIPALVALVLMLAVPIAAVFAQEAPPSFLLKWGTQGTGNGQFQLPWGIAVYQPTGDVYVADHVNHRIQKFDSSGGFITKWGSMGSGNGQFQFPTGIAVDTAGNVFVADIRNNRIQKFNSSGGYITAWGGYGRFSGQFDEPSDVAVDPTGNVYVADRMNHRIQKFTNSGVWIDQFGYYGRGSGGLYLPYGVSVDASGNVYVADTFNHLIQKFTGSGTFVTQWGYLGSSGSEDGQFNYPYDVSFDTSGNVYVADSSNHRIQKFTSNGVFITKWGSRGSGDGQFIGAVGVAVDGADNVYVSDMENYRVQKFGLFAGSPDINVTPSSLNFGPIPVGSSSSSQTVTVRNDGTANLIVSSAAISGANAGEFSKSSDAVSGQTLAPGAQATLQVVFSPASVGAKSATLSVPSNDPAENPVNVPLAGMGQAPDISVVPPFLGFGPVLVGSSSSPQMLIVRNEGNGNLAVGNVNILGINAGEFSKQNDNASGQILLPGAQATLQVVFNPASAGAKSAFMSILSNDPDENPVLILLAGSGQTPAEATQSLIGMVQQLNLQSGNSMVSILENAIRLMGNGTPAAANQLGAFIRQVEAQRDSKGTNNIPGPQADLLIEAAQRIIDSL